MLVNGSPVSSRDICGYCLINTYPITIRGTSRRPLPPPPRFCSLQPNRVTLLTPSWPVSFHSSNKKSSDWGYRGAIGTYIPCQNRARHFARHNGEYCLAMRENKHAVGGWICFPDGQCDGNRQGFMNIPAQRHLRGRKGESSVGITS